MKNICYAFASVSYHKKISFVIGICSAFFLLLSTSILNLIDMEKMVHNQTTNLVNPSDNLINYQKIMTFYSSLYFVGLFLWVILITTVIFISLQIKEQNIMKWRIMGFSNRFILNQAFWENLILFLAGMLTTAVFLLVFQHTYEFILKLLRSLITDGMGIKHTTFFSSNVQIESTPNQMTDTTGDTYFLSLGINRLPAATIFRAFLKNCLVVFSSTTGMTLLLTYSWSKKSTKVLRT